MSIHIDLSPEAQARLESQKRASTVSAVIISILTIALIALVLGLISLVVDRDDLKPIETYLPTIESTESPTKRNLPVKVEQSPSPPAAQSLPWIAGEAISPVAITIPDFTVDELSQSFGDGDFGEELGSGNGAGKGRGDNGYISGFPPVLEKRCLPEARLARLAEAGGTPECEEAVVKGLRWIKGNQQEDGSWNDGGQRVGMTGLAILAYLGHCETPESEEFGASCLKGILYLINNSQKNGGPMATSIASNHWPYENAIAVYALAEAYTFCQDLPTKIPNLKETVERAGQLIIDKQHTTSGAWDYRYDQSGTRGGDLSILGWHVQALKACKHTGLPFTGMKKCLRKAEDYVRSVATDDGGFGYTSNESRGEGWGYHTLTGVGVLSLQMMGSESSREARGGLRYIVEKSKFDYNGADCDLYGHYYEGQAAINRGGKVWEHYNKLFRDQLLNNQNADGSWKIPGTKSQGVNAVGAQYVGNAHYRTCLTTLMLEVYYRFLPGTSENIRRR